MLCPHANTKKTQSRLDKSHQLVFKQRTEQEVGRKDKCQVSVEQATQYDIGQVPLDRRVAGHDVEDVNGRVAAEKAHVENDERDGESDVF